MESISDLDCNQPIFHSHVHVVNHSTLPTSFTVRRVDTPPMRHDKIRDAFANLMSEVCYDVEIEPKPARKNFTKITERRLKYHESLKNSKYHRYFYKSNRAASARSFLAALVMPHQQLREQWGA